MGSIRSLVCVALLLFGAPGFTQIIDAPLIKGPEASLKKLKPNQSLRIAVWNLYKGSDERFDQEFLSLMQNSDLMLLQEVLLHRRKATLLSSDKNASWVMAEAWKQNGIPTGTALLSIYEFFFPIGILSPDSEPFASTPKSSVAFIVPIQNQKKSLMVLTTHSINFTMNAPFRRQLEAIAPLVAKHKGPVVWGGDFNTWRSSRWEILHEIMSKSGLSAISFEEDHRSLVLDHVFTRGLEIKNAYVLNDFKSSDHWPLYFTARAKK